MLDVIIKRSQWLRGEGSDVSRLLRPSDGKMCCIGFACLAAGLTTKDILDVGGLENLVIRMPKVLEDLWREDTTDSGTYHYYSPKVIHCLYLHNDRKGEDDFIREQVITRCGLMSDINFSFID